MRIAFGRSATMCCQNSNSLNKFKFIGSERIDITYKGSDIENSPFEKRFLLDSYAYNPTS